MSLYVNATQEECFRSLMDYFKMKRMRILTSNSPSYVRAEIGSWVSLGFGKAKGEVEATVVKRNGGSYVNLDFAFLKEHVSNVIGGIIMSLITFVAGLWIGNLVISGYTSSLPPLRREDFSSIASSISFLIIVLLAVIVFLTPIALGGKNASLTRRRFIEEFNAFMQSLASKKD